MSINDARTHHGSLYSYRSDVDEGNFVREAHGRKISAICDIYLLPTDSEEWGRLDKQHSALTVAMESLFPCPEIVEAVLAPDFGTEPKLVLDLGCGTGTWVIEVAHKFRHALVIGVDISPTPLNSEYFPLNARFEIDDINLGLRHWYGRCDLVHMRCVSGGLRNIDKTWEELQLCLRPGGLLIVVEGDLDLFNGERTGCVLLKKLPGDDDVNGVSEDGSWTRRLIWEAHHACRMAGADIDRAIERFDEGFYNSQHLDPKTVASGDLFFALDESIQGFDETQRQMVRYAGTLTRRQFFDLHRGLHRILLDHGLDQATLDQWSEGCDAELGSRKLEMNVRFRFSWGRRRAADGLPAPALPVVEGSTKVLDEQTSQAHRYPLFRIYRDAQEAAEESKKKLDSIGVLPIPAVKRVATWISATEDDY